MIPKQCYLTNARRFYFQLSEFYNPGYKFSLTQTNRRTLRSLGKNTKISKSRQERQYFQTRYDYKSKDELQSCVTEVYSLKKKPKGDCYIEYVISRCSNDHSNSKQNVEQYKAGSTAMKDEMYQHVFFDNSLIRKCFEQQQVNKTKESIQQPRTKQRRGVTEEAARKYLTGAPTFANSHVFTQMTTTSNQSISNGNISREMTQKSTEVSEVREEYTSPKYTKNNGFAGFTFISQESDPHVKFSETAGVRKTIRFPNFTRKSEFLAECTYISQEDEPLHVEELQPKKVISEAAAKKYQGLPTFASNHGQYGTSNTYRRAVPQRAYVNMFQGYNGAPGYFDAMLYKRTELAKLNFSTDARSVPVVTDQKISSTDPPLHFVSLSETWLPNVLSTSTMLKKLDELPADENKLEITGKVKDVKRKSMMLSKFKKMLKKPYRIFRKSSSVSTA